MAKRLLSSPPVVALGSTLAAGYILLVYATSKVRCEPADTDAKLFAQRPQIFAMWHGQFLMLPKIKPDRPAEVAAMVARHGDAEHIGAVLKCFGMTLIRGEGAGALRRNRGGAAALPFSTLGIVVGNPIWVPAGTDEAALEASRLAVERGLNEVTGRAYALAGATDPLSDVTHINAEKPSRSLTAYRALTRLAAPLAPLGAAVLTGPHWRNFADAYDELLRAGGCRQVGDAASLAEAALSLLADAQARAAMMARAEGAIARMSGALPRTIAELDRFLPPKVTLQHAS